MRLFTWEESDQSAAQTTLFAREAEMATSAFEICVRLTKYSDIKLTIRKFVGSSCLQPAIWWPQEEMITNYICFR